MRCLIVFCARVAMLVVLAGPVVSSAAAAGNDGFARGNQLYAAGKYAEAAAAYEDQVHHGTVSANLFYNLGDAYHRVGNRGRAILNYQRALLLEPSHAEAAANLAFIGGSRPAETTNGSPLSAEALSWLTSVACWFTVAGVMAAVFLRRHRRGGLAVAALSLLAAVAGAGGLWWMGSGSRVSSRALVVADGTAVLYSPADNSKVVTTLPAGAEVRVLSAQGPWSYASLGDGTRAWVSSGKIERLIPSR